MSESGFNADVAERLTGITYRQLDYWDRTGLVRPSIKAATGKGSRRVYAFTDLVELRVIARMLAAGVALPAVRKAVRYLKTHYTNVMRPLTQMTLLASGGRILVRTEGRLHLLDATASGQVVIAVSVAGIARELEENVVVLSTPRELTFRVRSRTYTAILTPDLESGGYVVEVPELPGCITEADTPAEARQRARDAASLWLAARTKESSRRRAAR